MFGKARWLASPVLLLMVAFFTVQLTSGLYLAAETSVSPEIIEFRQCMEKHGKDIGDCMAKEVKEDLAKVKDDYCQSEFVSVKCKAVIVCQFCNKDGGNEALNERVFTRFRQYIQNLTADKCKEWESMAPVMSAAAGCSQVGQRSGGFISDHGGLIGTIVVVALVVAGVIGMVVYKKGRSAQPGKVSKSISSTSATSSKTADSSKGGKSSKLALK